MLAERDSRILIVGGGGTMGSSTALHLARRGYTDIRLLDIYENPSSNSAGNDTNKIAGDDGAGLWGQMGSEAWDMWTSDPVFKEHAHEVGKADLTCDNERERELRAKYDAICAEGRGHLIEWLSGRHDIIRKLPHLAKANIDNTWRGIWAHRGGWVAARSALNSVGLELRRLGVKSAFGTAGTFSSLLLSPDSDRCIGVKTIDGTEWAADLVIIAAGAWSPTLIDLEGQCVSKAWIYGHIQLTPKEAEDLKGIPTMYHNKLGFFMEPQPGTGILKVVNEFAGYTNTQTCRPYPLTGDVTMSVPRSHADHPSDTFPAECEDDIKRLVDTCLPHLSGRPVVDRRMCWCTDTADAQWLLCEYPKARGVVLATGDSGHTFKMFPIVGKYVADLIEDKLPSERKSLWRWRPGQGDKNGTGRGGPPPKDLKDVDGWRHDGEIMSSRQ